MRAKRAGTIVAIAAIAALAGSSVWALDEPVVGHFSFGASLAQGKVGDILNDGWALHGGATWFSTSRPAWGLRLDFGVDWYDMKSAFLDQIDTDTTIPGIQPPDSGYARAWSGSVDVVWNPKHGGFLGWYLLAGAGVYYTRAELSQYGVAPGWWCDPWWGYCYPGVVSGEFLLEARSSWEWGLNAGAGLTFRTGGESEVYLEAVYHWMDTKNGTELIPITLGVRW